MNPEHMEALQVRKVILLAEIYCLLSVRDKAQKNGDAETFLASYNQWEQAIKELNEVRNALRRT